MLKRKKTFRIGDEKKPRVNRNRDDQFDRQKNNRKSEKQNIIKRNDSTEQRH